MLSATLIVSNEEQHLPGCLASLRGIADEIVVVDTGSSDASRELALAGGARVYDYPWHDDFAAARNFALERASGDWILYIDADERLRSCDRAALEVDLADDRLCAATVQFYPQTGFTAYRELRLFRRCAAIRFEGAFHETIVPSVDRIAAAGRGYMGASRLSIDHLGYDQVSVRKQERDLALLCEQLKKEPDRSYLWWHLGSIHRERGRFADAEAAWLSGVAAARRTASCAAERVLCFVELARRRLGAGRVDEVMELICEVRTFCAGNFQVDWLEARALAATRQYERAFEIFKRLGRVDADTLVGDFAYDKEIFGAGALAEIALCLFRRGRYAESGAWYRRAEALDPTNMALRIKRQLAVARAGTA